MIPHPVVQNPSVGGIILAGGESSRLGQDKAFVDAGGMPLVKRVVCRLQLVVDEIVLVTNHPRQFAFLGLPVTGDLYPGIGVLGGLHAGLSAVRADYGIVVGCDMPFLSVDLLRYMISLRHGYDVVLPRVGKYHEPLHALYSKRCLPCIERSIAAGGRRILPICDDLRVCYVDEAQIVRHDPCRLSFFNVNDIQDLDWMRARLAGEQSG